MIIDTSHHRFKDISNQTFGRLTALKIIGKTKKGYVWECVCECGSKTKTVRTKLESGHTRSCGCLIVEGRTNRAKHRMVGTPEHAAWCAMKVRCFTETDKRFSYYGGRGITVHPSWVNDFNAFFKEVGLRPTRKHSLDRIDVNGNYEPGNVRWADPTTQRGNRRDSIKA